MPAEGVSPAAAAVRRRVSRRSIPSSSASSPVFAINVPFAVVGVAVALWQIPESRSPGRVPLDPVGAVVSVVGLVALVYGIIEEPSRGWADPQIFGSLGLAAVVLAAFVWWELHTDHPMLEMQLFRDPRFSAASLSVTLVYFGLMGALFLLTQYLQGVLGLSVLQTGFRFVAIAVGIMAGAAVAAALTARAGTRRATTLGLVATGLGMGLMTTLGLRTGDAQIAGILALAAAGMGLAITPATDAIMASLPEAKFGVGSAVNDATREIGGAIGVAVLGSVFAGTYASTLAPALTALPADAAKAARDSLAGAGAVAAAIGHAGVPLAGDSLVAAARNAFVEAMGPTAIAGAAVALVGAVVAWTFLPDRADAPAPIERTAGAGGLDTGLGRAAQPTSEA